MALVALLHDEAVVHVLKDSNVVLSHPRTRRMHSARPYHVPEFGVLHAIAKQRVGTHFARPDDGVQHEFSLPVFLRYSRHLVMIEAACSSEGQWSWDRAHSRCFESAHKIVDARWGHFFPTSHLALTDAAVLHVNPLPPTAGKSFSSHPFGRRTLAVDPPEQARGHPLLATFDHHPMVFSIAAQNLLYSVDARAPKGPAWVSDNFDEDPICAMEKFVSPSHGIFTAHENSLRIWDSRKASAPVSQHDHLMGGAPMGMDVNQRLVVIWSHEPGDSVAFEMSGSYRFATFFELDPAPPKKTASSAEAIIDAMTRLKRQRDRLYGSQADSSKADSSGNDSSDDSDSSEEDGSGSGDSGSSASGAAGVHADKESRHSAVSDVSVGSMISAADGSQNAGTMEETDRFATLRRYTTLDESARTHFFRRYLGKKNMQALKARHAVVGGYLTPRARVILFDIYGNQNKLKVGPLRSIKAAQQSSK